MIDSLTFTAADVINISLATPSGIAAIDWLNGLDSLSLVFDSPFLTTAGGTITLNNIASDFNGDAISGSITAMSEPPTTVPEPTSTLSLLALGTLGAASTLKRKLKTSKSSEKELEKVG